MIGSYQSKTAEKKSEKWGTIQNVEMKRESKKWSKSYYSNKNRSKYYSTFFIVSAVNGVNVKADISYD